MKLLQVELRNKENKVSILYRYAGGLENSEIPIRIPPKDRDGYEVRFYVTQDADTESEEPAVIKDYDSVAAMLSEGWDGVVQDSGSEAERIVNDFILRERITIDNNMTFPAFSYEDITEQELFGSPAMQANDLSDKAKGLWAWHGKRKFRFTIAPHSLEPDEQVKMLCYFDKCDNKKIDRISFDFQQNAEDAYGFIDTDKFGELFTDSLQLHEFFGSIERSFSYKSRSGYTLTERFPIKLIVKNTDYKPAQKNCIPLQPTTHVSIDFGTSSTCIAIQSGGDIEMIALSPVDAHAEETVSFNRFENPTNLMMFRWHKVYEEWIQKTRQTEHFPLFTKGSRYDENAKTKEVHVDFGYTVKDTLKDGQKKDIDTILTELKMIPYLLNHQKQLRITPYIDEGTNTIYIVDSPEQQDKDHFDPVAFYGYLLGRAINNPSLGSIYVKYDVSYPVGFNAVIKEKIRHSLAYGLKLSLPAPLRIVREGNGSEKLLFNVAMKYSEPEAYIGAICGKHLTCNDKPSLFAVFDFGGGTLDFSFGIFRKKDNGLGKGIIQFLGSGGQENFGGEYLINLISFWILTENQDNKQQIIESTIPFIVPRRAQKPDAFPESLFSTDRIAQTNMRSINERISRNIFEDKAVEADSVTESVDLFTQTGEQVTVSLVVDYAVLKDKLGIEIDRVVDGFKSSMEQAFNTHENVLAEYGIAPFNITDVHIYRSGNSSRSSLVQQSMQSRFDGCSIELIDETESTGKTMRYAITPKTAVAYGQLRLGSNLKVEKREFFKWNILRENFTDGQFEVVINRSDTNKVWQLYNEIEDGHCDIFFSEIPNTEKPFRCPYEANEKFNAIKDGYLYIRIADETTIDCFVSKDDTAPASELEEADVQRIILEEM